MSLDLTKVQELVNKEWHDTILSSMEDYIRVPNQSPQFDPDCFTNGLQEEALEVVMKWIRGQDIKGMAFRSIHPPGRTPFLYLEIAPTDPSCTNTILAYSHLDKQPPMLPWSAGLDPYQPVLRTEQDPLDATKTITKLYGRGGADDGYGIYATLVAIKAVQAQGLPHARIVGFVEMCEESGSFDLPYYLALLKDEIGTPDLIICLDSNCGDYNRLWMTTSLRGMVGGVLSVESLKEGVHSGMGSGICPSTFRILRELLDRVENSSNGEILVKELHAVIPEDQLQYAKDTVGILGSQILSSYPLLPTSKAVSDDPYELYLNRAWRPTVSYTGMGDIPPLQSAGNVLRPKTSIQLSFRLPPTVNSAVAQAELKKILEADPPYGAKVTFTSPKASNGFYAPPFEPWLRTAFNKASQHVWNKDVAYESGGVSIPFLQIMCDAYPEAQFAVAGLLGPKSNAHSSDEMMMVEYMLGIVTSMSEIVATHYVEKVEKKE